MSPISFERPDPPPDDADLVLLLENDDGRAAFLDFVRRALPEGECLVEVKDLHASRRFFTTRPRAASAKLVARCIPRLLRGSLLSVVSYYRMPKDVLDAVETHHENGRFTHSYEVRLAPVVEGRAKAPSRPAC